MVASEVDLHDVAVVDHWAVGAAVGFLDLFGVRYGRVQPDGQVFGNVCAADTQNRGEFQAAV